MIRKRCNILKLVVLGLTLYLFHIFFCKCTKNSNTNLLQTAFFKDTLKGDSFESDMKCRIPELRVDDPELQKFYYHVQPVNCAKEKNWVFAKNGLFHIDENMEKVHGKVSCNLSYFSWKSDRENLWSAEIQDFAEGSPLESEYFLTMCEAKDHSKYTNVHATILPSKHLIASSRASSKPETWSGLNVYILAFDSISRMTALRKLPKTVSYLKKNLEAVILHGYNIVGDGTPQAFTPILTGKTEEELPLTRMRFKDANFVDVYPWIWNSFTKAGYVTAYAEDTSSTGTYQTRLKGFKRQPTTHYMRTFYLEAEKNTYRSLPYCIGNEPHFTGFIHQPQEFFDAYPKDIPKFALFFHGSLSHDDLNAIETADEEVVNHLKYMEEKEHLNNTLLIVMADHGHRFAQIRQTHQGQLEERLPLMSFVMPKWFKGGKGKKGWENLIKNVNRLSSPFDIHATLADLLDWKDYRELGDVRKRSISLWQEIPKERSCEQADIAPHWCTCLEWENIPSTDTDATYLAKYVIRRINNETETQRHLCVPLSLDKVVSAKRLVPHEALMKYKWVKDPDGFVPDFKGNTRVSSAHYQLKFYATPGEKLYEATVSHNLIKNETVVDLTYISHVNKYGDQPHCIKDVDPLLLKWCICYDKIHR